MNRAQSTVTASEGCLLMYKSWVSLVNIKFLQIKSLEGTVLLFAV